MKFLKINNKWVQYVVLAYWSIFWLFNSLDKLIGGSQFLWVGRDRFAQFQKFFASVGLDSPMFSNIALIITAALEVFAFVFFSGALIHYLKNNKQSSRSWFFIGITLTLIIFTIFSIGDHIFGDRFELLEHTLFWFITLFSWVAFIRLNQDQSAEKSSIKKSQFVSATIIIVILVLISSGSIFRHNEHAFSERSEALETKKIGENVYKISFPFLGGSTVFEKSMAQFIKTHPAKRIDHIYTVPNELRLKKADGLIVYIITEDKK